MTVTKEQYEFLKDSCYLNTSFRKNSIQTSLNLDSDLHDHTR
jgi:hypothetical protein